MYAACTRPGATLGRIAVVPEPYRNGLKAVVTCSNAQPTKLSTCDAPIAQLAEAADLKSAQCGFESDWGGVIVAAQRVV